MDKLGPHAYRKQASKSFGQSLMAPVNIRQWIKSKVSEKAHGSSISST